VSSELLAFVAVPAAFIGGPWLAWQVARRRGATDRRLVRMTAVACLFIAFGLLSLTWQHWWIGAYFALFGAGELWLARWLRRVQQNAIR